MGISGSAIVGASWVGGRSCLGGLCVLCGSGPAGFVSCWCGMDGGEGMVYTAESGLCGGAGFGIWLAAGLGACGKRSLAYI